VTGENQRRNALDELFRAETCLQEARALDQAGFPYGAVSRAYYAVFHAAQALLFSVGIEVRTHKAMVSLIGEHFVRPGRLSSTMGRLVSRMQRDREDADYATGAVFTDQEANQMIGDAETFLAEARRLIPPE
jgi:uncharacterized protein (UPF0332 family)